MKQDFTKYPKLFALVDAIFKFEGGGPGLNNPGNIRCPVTNTAVWNHLAVGEINGFCNFPDLITATYAEREKFYNICTSQSLEYNTEGWKMFHVQKCEDLTLYQVIQIYAPTKDNNNPLHYATVVSGWLNIGLDFVMKEFLITTITIAIESPEPTPIVPIQQAIVSPQPPVATFSWSLWLNTLLGWFRNVFRQE